jgi:hypothetical protein
MQNYVIYNIGDIFHTPVYGRYTHRASEYHNHGAIVLGSNLNSFLVARHGSERKAPLWRSQYVVNHVAIGWTGCGKVITFRCYRTIAHTEQCKGKLPFCGMPTDTV